MPGNSSTIERTTLVGLLSTHFPRYLRCELNPVKDRPHRVADRDSLKRPSEEIVEEARLRVYVPRVECGELEMSCSPQQLQQSVNYVSRPGNNSVSRLLNRNNARLRRRCRDGVPLEGHLEVLDVE